MKYKFKKNIETGLFEKCVDFPHPFFIRINVPYKNRRLHILRQDKYNRAKIKHYLQKELLTY
jgi:hypothetical protein